MDTLKWMQSVILKAVSKELGRKADEVTILSGWSMNPDLSEIPLPMSATVRLGGEWKQVQLLVYPNTGEYSHFQVCDASSHA